MSEAVIKLMVVIGLGPLGGKGLAVDIIYLGDVLLRHGKYGIGQNCFSVKFRSAILTYLRLEWHTAKRGSSQASPVLIICIKHQPSRVKVLGGF